MTVTEQELARKAKAPRVTLEALEANIEQVIYFTAKEGFLGSIVEGTAHDRTSPCEKSFETLGLLTFCVLVLRNGFTVHGVSACASPENFDREIGERIAYENAKSQIWGLMGYELKSELKRQTDLEEILGAENPLTFLMAYALGNKEALTQQHARKIIETLTR